MEGELKMKMMLVAIADGEFEYSDMIVDIFPVEIEIDNHKILEAVKNRLNDNEYAKVRFDRIKIFFESDDWGFNEFFGEVTVYAPGQLWSIGLEKAGYSRKAYALEVENEKYKETAGRARIIGAHCLYN